MPFPHLGELGSAYAQVLLVAGVALLMPFAVDPQRTLHRVVLFAVAIFLALRYALWRATETLAPVALDLDFLASGSLFVIEMLTLAGSISAFIIMSRVRSRRREADQHAGWWGENDPRVAILIATYNEELDILERTIVGAKSLRYANKDVVVLDDGRRDWLRDYCMDQKVRYVRRPDNEGSKAGNINHALRRLSEDPVTPDFVAILDADFVPHRGFISRSLALFHDPAVGLVQTPQHFFNADPIQHNLGLTRSYPDEQRFFFDHLQASRDGWGIAICCGTSSVCRWQALSEIDGLPMESVTEDFMLTLALQNIGWRTVYLNEPLTEGLAPEGIKEYISQRARWCLGLMQIARSWLGPFGRNNLRLRDRWSVTDSLLYWSTTFVFRLAALVYPLLYWYFNITVVDARLPEVIAYFGTFYLWNVSVLNLLSRGTVMPVLHDVNQLIGAIHISRAAIFGLLKPKGQPFSVTAKGGDRSRVVVQWRILAPFAMLFALTLVGLILGIVWDRFAYYDAGDGKWVVLYWTIYNLFVLSITLLACVELPRRERHVADAPARAMLESEGDARPVWIASLTADTARLRGRRLEQGTGGILDIAEVGPVPIRVISPTTDGVRVQLLPDEAQRERLFLRFHAGEGAPGVARVRLSALLADFARRLSFSDGPR